MESTKSTLNLVWLLLLSSISLLSAEQPQFVIPKSIVEIKTPQLIGILAGVAVFVTTLLVVFYLFYKSGSATRLLQEIQGGSVSAEQKATGFDLVSSSPELYDSLLQASVELPKKAVAPIMLGQKVILRALNETDKEKFLLACNGSARFDESAYNPRRLFGWFDDISEKLSNNNPANLEAIIEQLYFQNNVDDESHVVIIERLLKCPIGALSLLQNQPKNLSVRIGRLWLTPAYQTKRIAHEAMLIVLEWLFRIGYRRVTVEVDTRHIIMRKFLDRCGFRQEAVFRKHKIFEKRNRDTALYVILNNEFHDVNLQLRKYVGFPVKPPTKKVAEIENVALTKTRNATAPEEANLSMKAKSLVVQQEITTEMVVPPREIVQGIVTLHQSCYEIKCFDAKFAAMDLPFDKLMFPKLKKSGQQNLHLVGVGVRKKNYVLLSFAVYHIGIYMANSVIECGKNWASSNQKTAFADELFDLSLQGNSEPKIVIVLHFDSTVTSDSFYFDIFGDYLSNIFPDTSVGTLDNLAHCFMSSMKIVSGRKCFAPGSELVITILGVDTVSISNEKYCRVIILGEQTTKRMLEFFLESQNVSIDTALKTVNTVISVLTAACDDTH